MLRGGARRVELAVAFPSEIVSLVVDVCAVRSFSVSVYKRQTRVCLACVLLCFWRVFDVWPV